ncbi:hypothetical protein BV25DRAFT_1839913 [Artomyces pyxidatus]|uniref:Uncharacterized protein n=1 Tax=Artomyces pyxidatus TaxID=48021 RepID=A0ACB8SUB3_9AGAM|nr:hypothetical protein BV25DRAFT_1839913 [Artomyces pyxidatus]
MSQGLAPTNPTLVGSGRPQHRLHDTSEPLPGARSQDAPEYSTGAIEGTGSLPQDRTWNDSPQIMTPNQRPDDWSGSSSRTTSTQDQSTAFNSKRSLNTQKTPSVRAGGGVRRGSWKDDLPVGKANVLDKVIGKTEKASWRAVNPDLHETGQLREAGGKKAAVGEARIPLD